MEMKQLSTFNVKLIDDLKEISHQLDIKVNKIKSFTASPTNESASNLLDLKMASSHKQLKNYQKEIQNTTTELDRISTDKVGEVKEKIVASEKSQGELQKRVADLNKKVTLSAKELAQYTQKKDNGVFETEENAALMALNNSKAKTEEYEQQLKTMADQIPAREAKIKQLEQTAEELTKEVGQLHKDAAKFSYLIEKKEDVPKTDKNQMKSQIEAAKAEIEVFIKQYKEEKSKHYIELDHLKEQMKSLELVLWFCS